MPARVAVPGYLDDDLRIGIVHFGVGNFHRAHQAMYLDRLLNAGLAGDWAICGVGLLDRDARMRDALTAQDGLYTLTLRHPDGVDEPAVIGSLRRFLHAPDDPSAVLEQLVSPHVRIVSLTITEGGYVSDPINGRHPGDDPLVAEEVAGGLARPLTAFGWIVAALRERRRRGVTPFTVLSCDNIQGNGAVARLSVEGVARLVDADLAHWISTEVAFPSTMVDRITPVTTPEDVARVAAELGVSDAWPVSCEPFAQWIIEDRFPAGRPPLEQAGVVFVADIEAYEAIKLRLLNGSHQAIAYIGRLAGYTFVDEACRDPRILAFLRAYLAEAAATLAVPDGFDLGAYVRQLFERFGNPAIRDTLARLSVDASNRMPKFMIPMITDRVAAGRETSAGAAVVAAWRMYCRAASTGEFVLEDAVADELVHAALGGPTDFLHELSTLAPLAADAGFVREYERHLAALAAGGADVCLAGFAGASG
jgi:mannitol 2-dehydrogenase